MKQQDTGALMEELLGLRLEQKERVKKAAKLPTNNDVIDYIESETKQQTSQLNKSLTGTIQKEVAKTKIQPNTESPSLFVNTTAKEPVDPFDKESLAFKSTWQELLSRLDTINTKIAGFPTELKLSTEDQKSIQSLIQILEKNASVSLVPKTDTPVLSVEKVDAIISNLGQQVNTLTTITEGIKELTKSNAKPAVLSDNTKLIEAINSLQETTKTSAFEQTRQQLQAIQTLRESLGTKAEPIGKDITDALIRLSKIDLTSINKETVIPAPKEADEKLVQIIKQAQADISFIKGLDESVLEQLKKITQSIPAVNTALKPAVEKAASVNVETLTKKVENAKLSGATTVTLDKQSIGAIKAVQSAISPELLKRLNLLQEQIKAIPVVPVVSTKETLEIVKSTVTEAIKPVQAPVAASIIKAPEATMAATSNDMLKQGKDILESINSLQKILAPALLKLPDTLSTISAPDVTKKFPTEQLDGILKGITDMKATQEVSAGVKQVPLALPSFDTFIKNFGDVTSRFEQISKIEPTTLTKGVNALSVIGETKLDNILPTRPEATKVQAVNAADLNLVLKPIISELIMPSIKAEIAPLVKPMDSSGAKVDSTADAVKQALVETKATTAVSAPAVGAPNVGGVVDAKSASVAVAPKEDAKPVAYDELAKSNVSVKMSDAGMALPNVKSMEPVEKNETGAIMAALQEQTKAMTMITDRLSKSSEKIAPKEAPKGESKEENKSVTNISLTKNEAAAPDWQQVLIQEIRKMSSKLDALSNNLLRKSANRDGDV